MQQIFKDSLPNVKSLFNCVTTTTSKHRNIETINSSHARFD